MGIKITQYGVPLVVKKVQLMRDTPIYFIIYVNSVINMVSILIHFFNSRTKRGKIYSLIIRDRDY